jgi:Flp pilus assembly protein TadG
MVTVETAMVLPVLVMFALVGVAAVGVAQVRLKCADAADQAARLIARGDPDSAAGLARAVAGRPVTVASSRLGPDTLVTVRTTLRPIRWLAPVTITESATVASEPGEPP